jgi:phosphoglycerate-specific signal transduction histidine kinase
MIETLSLTLFTLVCMVGAYFWGRYETQISDEVVDDSSPVTKNS